MSDSGRTNDLDAAPDPEDGGETAGLFSGFVTGWSDLTLPRTLQIFLNNPRNFVLGAVLTGILEAAFGVVRTTLNLIELLFLGSRPSTLAAPGETLGIADIPVYIAQSLGGVGGSVGTSLIDGIRAFHEPIFENAAFAGPATPLIVIAVLAVETIVVLWLLQRAVYIIADWLQLGGVTE